MELDIIAQLQLFILVFILVCIIYITYSIRTNVMRTSETSERISGTSGAIMSTTFEQIPVYRRHTHHDDYYDRHHDDRHDDRHHDDRHHDNHDRHHDDRHHDHHNRRGWENMYTRVT